eukprot:11531327-Karenia_brevis.AAC.1
MGYAAWTAAVLIGLAALVASVSRRGHPVRAKQNKNCGVNNVVHWPYPRGTCQVMYAPGQTIPTGEDHGSK